MKRNVELEHPPGVEKCQILLWNKSANDFLMEGLWKGKACVVKCSTRAPESIEAGFQLAQKVYALAPTVVAEPYSVFRSADGRAAYDITRKIAGGTLTRLLKKGLVDEHRADRFALDIQKIACALKQAGIVHRDLWTDNLLLGEDGHLKVIDFQFALAANSKVEHAWLVRNWKFGLFIFGYNARTGLGEWNDFISLRNCLSELPQTEVVRRVDAALAKEEESGYFSLPVSRWVRFKICLYRLSLKFQLALRSSSEKRDAIARRLRHLQTKLTQNVHVW